MNDVIEVKPYSMDDVMCVWIEQEDDGYGYWDTGCGESHLFFGGTSSNNHYKFCPYCGKPIKEEK